MLGGGLELSSASDDTKLGYRQSEMTEHCGKSGRKNQNISFPCSKSLMVNKSLEMGQLRANRNILVNIWSGL